METGLFLMYTLVVLSIIQLSIIICLVFKGSKDSKSDISKELNNFKERLDRQEISIKDEFSRNREELSKSISTLEIKFSSNITNFTTIIDNKIKALHELMDSGLRNNRAEVGKSIEILNNGVTASITRFSDFLNNELKSLSTVTKESLDKNRDAVEKKLLDIQTGNEKKLEEMRHTVDEKLHKTLETRLGESFKLVSERLELVQKGLGEMQTLATDVGSLKNVLANVKTKGNLGEYQLGAILEQVLTPNQYGQSVKIKDGKVDFVVKIPSKEDTNKIILLPIDSKFPTVDYERLLDAYEKGEKEAVVQAQKELKAEIVKWAKSIHEKYVDPPNTTEFAVMFLPFEGLYAEVLRIPGLFEYIQNTFKINISGPSTISAFLNSMQMGFRSLAVEKRTSEIWDLLGAVRTEFGKFGEVLQKTKEKLDSASKEIDKAGTRSKAIEKKLRDVQTLPEGRTQKILNDIDLNYEDNEE